MSIICSKCGHELPDGAKFCGSCGNKVEAKAINTSVCQTCGSTLKVGAKFCGVCGSSAPVVNVPQAEEKENPNPTMDELVPPVITDETFANDQMTNVHEGDPTIDAVEIQPEKKPQPQPVQQTAAPVQPAPAPVQTAQPQNNAVPGQQTAAPQNNVNANAYNQNQQNPQYQPYPNPAQNGTTPGKSGGSVILPIILIILILAVIAVDVFVLFPDKIFGSDDSSKSKNDIVTVVDDFTVENL